MIKKHQGIVVELRVEAVLAIARVLESHKKRSVGTLQSTVETRFYVYFRQQEKIRKIGSYVKSNLPKNLKHW